jgi:hypothetical protein
MVFCHYLPLMAEAYLQLGLPLYVDVVFILYLAEQLTTRVRTRNTVDKESCICHVSHGIFTTKEY